MDPERLAEQFEAERSRLRRVAHRLLGPTNEADDAVQETWLRLSRTNTDEVANLDGWLTTVVSRVCLDKLRSRGARQEEPLTSDVESIAARANPEQEALVSDSVGIAMADVMEHLAPAERVAFVLHDAFGLSFEEIASIVDRSPAAARKLASRGRRRLQAKAAQGRGADPTQHRDVVEAFFRASHGGDFEALLAVLAPDVLLRPDEAALRMGARTGWLSSELRGSRAVADQFAGQAQAAELVLIDGVAGAVWAPGGTPRVAFIFHVREGRVAEIELVADAARIAQFGIDPLP